MVASIASDYQNLTIYVINVHLKSFRTMLMKEYSCQVVNLDMLLYLLLVLRGL